MEFALLTDPTNPDPLPVNFTISGDRVEFSYLRAQASLSYAVEMSEDLVNWSTAGVTQDSSSTVGSIATATAPIGSASFLRLVVREQ
jgi:hypothetical protein